MKELSVLNKYFWKYRYRFILGFLFITASNYFAVMSPQVFRYVVGKLQETLPGPHPEAGTQVVKDVILAHFFSWMDSFPYGRMVLVSSIVIIVLALIRGLFMFFMRQTIIVMSRHIEYDQKNEVYEHYQTLDAGFYKTHSTGDLMNRMAEDVSRVRMYTGPAIMYFINLTTLIALCLINMLQQDVRLTLIVISPLPILALTIYFLNINIHKRSTRVQALLSDLTTNAQESFSGIRVIKSYVQEKAILGFFRKSSEEYRKNAVGLAKMEAVYFPSMNLIIGLSTLITVLIGCQIVLHDTTKVGLIVEFVIYILLLIFPVSAIGWVASMTQRAAASQKRLNEFLEQVPAIQDKPVTKPAELDGDILFEHISFTYPNTGIKAIKDFNLRVKKGEKVLILGKTGSGKSTVAHLLLRSFDPDHGNVYIKGVNIKDMPFRQLRHNISYVPQDVFLFSDTIANNISFGLNEKASRESIEAAARSASIHNEILELENGYETMVGERGVMLSGGQKQRVSIARALIKEPELMVFDDCLSAVDAKTENQIISHLNQFLSDKTAIIITHRIFTVFNFDQIIIIDDGMITERGTHDQLMKQGGYYAELYRKQITEA
ncbi:ABC transporter ATP-binding protein [Arachidicoccus terrestris]|uniref:ABC transporter ATP-binding protein n=1 Tax=Arachidicoccus terrestris TaxID=2875539 RepID=UPI001CC57D91|nr:ABC transporter ATP-binding protein [Arachidicoccus terrestris]UAY56281.1 ABC transporter ATP-binding protein/permease [Arachidicoccus terrestris]